MIRIRMGLPLKFIFSVAVVIVITSLTLTYYLIRQQAIQIRKAGEDRCRTYARSLANSSEMGVYSGDRLALSKTVQSFLKEDDVIYGVVYDKDGDILAYSQAPNAKEVFRETEALVAYRLRSMSVAESDEAARAKEMTSHNFTTKNGEEIYDVLFPLTKQVMEGSREDLALMYGMDFATTKEELVGFARVGISRERMNQQIRALWRSAIIITLCVAFLGIAIAVFFVRRIVRPIRQLTLGTQKIASGDLNYRVEVKSNDEIGELAEFFNQMAADLRNYIKELNREKEDLLNLKIALEQRTDELEKTLAKMKGMQQELLRSEKFATIGRLASSVAHELRNPLASLKNISYYLLKLGTFVDEKPKKMLEMLSNDVTRANKIVTDLLDFSRVKKLNKVPTQMDDFITKLLDNIMNTLGDNLQIVKELEQVQAEIDPDRVTQVVVNLVTNARDAMPDGGTITISVKQLEDKVQILVKDNGCGMDKETADRIFEPLFTTKTKGLGLGLAICKEIIEAHFGRISVESEKGKGTAFEILLPLM